jgi:hypothetical protein
MKKIVISLFFIATLNACLHMPKNKILFSASKLDGVYVAMNNFDSGEKHGEFIAMDEKGKINFIPEENRWNVSQYMFIDCEVINLSDHIQLAELMIDEDRWTMGGIYLDPGDKKIVRTIIMRQNPSKKQLSQFPNMNGHPGGSIRLWWKSYNPDSIKRISLYLPLSEKGDLIKIGNITASEAFKTYSDEEYKALMPIIDEFGQFIHKEWPGKIKTNDELLLADAKEVADLDANPGYTSMSRFGGWKDGPQLNATGHFRVEKYKGMWAIVDPEGYLFWSHGIDCVRPASGTPVEGREQFYKFLPDSSGEFKDFVSTGRVSSTYTPDSTGKIDVNAVKFVDFYGMNLERKWGEEYKTNFVNRTIKRLKSWEMNTIANWSDKNVFEKREIPYTINVNTARSRMLIDPFDPAFQTLIETQLTTLYSESLNDPWCLGIFVDNEISWGNENSLGTTVITTERYPFAREFMINTLKKKYRTVEALNRVWRSDFGSWEDLRLNRERYARSTRDIRTMSRQFADEYFRKCRSAIKKVAPDKLYLGCRFDFHFYPENDNNRRDWVVSHGAEYADIVSFNRYNYSCNTMRPVENMDFPIILGEFHVGALDRGLPHSGLRHSNDQKERAFVYKNFLMQAVRNPYIVGVGWFQYLDQPYTGRNDGENYQIGFITVGDYPNQEIVESAREVGQNMYKVRYGNKN